MFGSRKSAAPVGVVLAGGRGRRIGGDKAVVELDGRALVLYPLQALQEVCDEVVVVAKRDTLLPRLAGIAGVWVEPDEPRHPLAGIAHALRLAAGRAVLVVAVDLPLVDAALLQALCEADTGSTAAVVPRVHGHLEPLCALYTPLALEPLTAFDPDAPARRIVEALGPVELEPPDAGALLNVNRPEDLLQASALLARREVRR